MALVITEVKRGVVAYLDGDLLVSDPSIITDNAGYIGERPFVCLEASGSSSTWYLLTKQYNPRRLLLDGWKQPGSSLWMKEPQYLNDARKSFSGPTAVFVAAGASEIPHRPHARPSISETGMLEIEKEIAKYS